MVVHTCLPSICKAEAGGLPQVYGNSGLHSEFAANPNNIATPAQKNKEV